MYCTRCGKEVEEGMRFCPSCGQEVGAATVASGLPTSTPTGPASAAALPPSYLAARATPAYGGFWIRFAAYLIDSVILGIPYVFAVVMVIFLMGGFAVIMNRDPSETPQEFFALLAPFLAAVIVTSIGFFVLHWLYYAVMESSARQATFGKSLMSLRVANSEGRRLSFGHATGRFFAKLISGMIPFGIGYIMAGFTAKKQALHDFIAGTLVLRN